MSASESEAGNNVGLMVRQWILDTNIWLDWFVTISKTRYQV